MKPREPERADGEVEPPDPQCRQPDHHRDHCGDHPREREQQDQRHARAEVRGDVCSDGDQPELTEGYLSSPSR